MNSLFHFFFNYIIMNFLITNADTHITLIFIASTIVDLDHLPYILRERSSVLHNGFELGVRTIFHEFPALILILSLLLLINIWVSEEIIMIICACLLFHYTIDFLFGETQPFKPIINEVIDLDFSPESRFFFELILTLITGGITWFLIN